MKEDCVSIVGRYQNDVIEKVGGKKWKLWIKKQRNGVWKLSLY